MLEFLFEQLSELKKTRVRQILKHGCVSVEGTVTTKHNHALEVGDEVQIRTEKQKSPARITELGLEIIYEDRDLIAISKPAGLLSVASAKVQNETAISAINEHVNIKASGRTHSQKSVYIVHRLDRDVSGVMLFAKNERMKIALQENWSTFTKEYLTVVEGRPERESDTLVSYLSENKILRVDSGPEREGARLAETYYEVIQSKGSYSLLKVILGTGRKHQIRVHLAEMGCPVTGDKIYGAMKNPLRRIALHACSLKITHPITHEPLEIFSPAPENFWKITV